MEKTCIIIVGPTAIGKTAVAIQIAQSLHTEIISSDSRQCYKELSIGVAKPSHAELAIVPHYFIDSHSIQEEVNAAVFERYALEKVNEIFIDHDVAVMVGGTGLYIKAFCDGIDFIPAIDDKVRQKILHQYQQLGLGWLQAEVSTIDPDYFAVGEIQNPQRLMRALEVKQVTGQSILNFQSGQKKKRNFTIKKIGLDLPREQLYSQINRRVDTMMKNGLPEEVESLLPYQQLSALQTVGYKELFAYLSGKMSKSEAIEKIKQNTRHYAKRQITWFKKDESIAWFDAVNNEQCHQLSQTILAEVL